MNTKASAEIPFCLTPITKIIPKYMPTTKYQRIFTKPKKTKGADKVLKSEYVTSISDATVAVISSKKLLTFKSEKDYLLLFSNSDSITVYSGDIPYILNKGNYTVLWTLHTKQTHA